MSQSVTSMKKQRKVKDEAEEQRQVANRDEKRVSFRASIGPDIL